MVMLFKPEDIQTMYSSDGRIPMLPGFDNFEYSRNVSMKDRFPSAGLISNKVKFVYTFPMLFRPFLWSIVSQNMFMMLKIYFCLHCRRTGTQ